MGGLIFSYFLKQNSAKTEEKLQIYKNYLNYELKTNENSDHIEPRIQCLFERTIADGANCLDSSVWLMYTNYQVSYCAKFFFIIKKLHNENNLKNEHAKSETDRIQLLQLYKRALRNSPWTGKLWVNYALCLEYNASPAVEIKSKY